MADRRRMRYGSGGGGGGGLQALLNAIAGSPQDNPDFGKAPGDIDFNYAGDPTELAAKPYKDPGFFRRLAGDPGSELNARYNLSQLSAATQLANQKSFADYANAQKLAAIPKEIEATGAANARVAADARNRDWINLAQDLNTYSTQEGMPLLSPEQYRFRFGARGPAQGIPVAQAQTGSLGADAALDKLRAEQELAARLQLAPEVMRSFEAGLREPMLRNEAMGLSNQRSRFQMPAERSAANLQQITADQEASFRSRNPDAIDVFHQANFGYPVLRNDAAILANQRVQNQLPLEQRQAQDELLARQTFAPEVQQGLQATFRRPSLQYQLEEAQLPWAGSMRLGDTMFMDPNNLGNYVTVLPGDRGGDQVVSQDASGKAVMSRTQPRPDQVIRVQNGYVIRPRRNPYAP